MTTKSAREKARSRKRVWAVRLLTSPTVSTWTFTKKIFHVTFACGHSDRYIETGPVPDDILFCSRCWDDQAVVKVDQRME